MLILRQNSKKIICLQVNLLTFFAKIFFAGIYFGKLELTLALDPFYKCDSCCVTFMICHMLSQIIRKRWQTIELEKIVDKTHDK